MTDLSIGMGEETVSKLIMVPWDGKVKAALRYVASDNNKGVCGLKPDPTPCYSNFRRMQFVKGANLSYYDIRLALSGTDIGDDAASKAKTVRAYERFTFVDGIYTMQERVGDITIVERAIADFE